MKYLIYVYNTECPKRAETVAFVVCDMDEASYIVKRLNNSSLILDSGYRFYWDWYFT